MRGFGEVAERLRRSTARVFTRGSGGGSGIVWSADGLILTNAHVARDAAAEVELWDSRRRPAAVVARDPRRDLATLRIAADGLEPAIPGDSTSLRPGELVLAIGSPFGFAGALSSGVVHSVGERWILAAVRLAPGNSGGALAGADGRVVGINTAVVNGMGAAVPMAAALDFLARGPRPSLGVTLAPAPSGLIILDVAPGSRAEAASLRPGDVLLCTVDELHRALDAPGPLRVRFLRGGRRRLFETAA
ncbi:MAG TPA: trypsin-like peptidase domain-containing protein [Thermodesulfobacteriota bacterium]